MLRNAKTGIHSQVYSGLFFAQTLSLRSFLAHLLLLAKRLFVALLPLRFGFALAGGRFFRRGGLHLGVQFAIVNKHLHAPSDANGDYVGEEIVVTQPARIVIEEEEHHDGHEIHHRLHHSRAGAAGLAGLRQTGVEPQRHGHQQREKAHVVAIPRYIKWQI